MNKRVPKLAKSYNLRTPIAPRAASTAQAMPIYAHLTARSPISAAKTLHLLYIMPTAGIFAEKAQNRQPA